VKLLKPVAVALEKEGYDVYSTWCVVHPGSTLKLGDDMMLTTHAHCDLPSRPPRHTRVHGDNNEFYLCVPAPGTFHLDFEVGHVQVRQLVVLPINGLDFVVLAHVMWEKTIQTADQDKLTGCRVVEFVSNKKNKHTGRKQPNFVEISCIKGPAHVTHVYTADGNNLRLQSNRFFLNNYN
jgi:hypothetical protein